MSTMLYSHLERLIVCAITVFCISMPNYADASSSREKELREPLLGGGQKGGSAAGGYGEEESPSERLWNEIVAKKPKPSIDESSQAMFRECYASLQSFGSPNVRVIKNKPTKFRVQLFVTGDKTGVCYSKTENFEGIEKFTKQGYTALCGKKSYAPSSDNGFLVSERGVFDQETGWLINGIRTQEPKAENGFLISMGGKFEPAKVKLALQNAPSDPSPGDLPPPPPPPPEISPPAEDACSRIESLSDVATPPSDLYTGQRTYTYKPSKENQFRQSETGTFDLRTGNWIDVHITYVPDKTNSWVKSQRAIWDVSISGGQFSFQTLACQKPDSSN